MSGHRHIKPTVLVVAHIENGNRANAGISLNPFLVAEIGENVNATRCHGKIAGHEAVIIQLSDGAVRFEWHGVISIPLPQGFRARVIGNRRPSGVGRGAGGGCERERAWDACWRVRRMGRRVLVTAR